MASTMPKFELFKELTKNESFHLAGPSIDDSERSFSFDSLEISLPVDDSPKLKGIAGIGSPPRVTKGKYRWSECSGWKKEEYEEEK